MIGLLVFFIGLRFFYNIHFAKIKDSYRYLYSKQMYL